MKLFINSGVCERKWNGNVKMENLNSSALKLSIPNYLEAEDKREYIKFILPDTDKKSLEKDCVWKGIALKKTSKNTYNGNHQSKKQNSCMYALLRSTSCIPDDVFIPASMKDKVKVLKRMRFWDSEVDYGDFLSNVYLIEISLDPGESLPVFLAYNNPKVLDKHYVFYRKTWWDEDYHVSKKLETYIILNDQNKAEYISLSSLCEGGYYSENK